MNEKVYSQVIEKLCWEEKTNAEIMKPAIEFLSSMKDEDIYLFDDYLEKDFDNFDENKKEILKELSKEAYKLKHNSISSPVYFRRYNEFWNIISKCDFTKEDDSDILKPLIDYLVSVDDEYTFMFEDCLEELMDFLYTEKFFELCVDEDGFCSDDSFLYTRRGVIAHGKEYFYKAIKGDDSKLWDFDISLEDLGYVHWEVWDKKHPDSDYDVDKYENDQRILNEREKI